MIHSAVVGILHRQHPAEIPEQLVQQVGQRVFTLRDIQFNAVGVFWVILYQREHGSHGDPRIHDIFVVIAGIVPAFRGADNRAFWSLGGGGRGMHQHTVIRVAGCALPFPGILLRQGGGDPLKVVGFDRCIGDLLVHVRTDPERVRGAHALHMKRI